MGRSLGTTLGSSIALVALAAVLPALAQDEPELGWSDVAELGFVATSGNAESSSLGFKNLASRRWEHALFELNAGAVRVENTTETPVVDPLAPTTIILFEDTDVTTESYFLNGRYDHEINPKFFWFTGAGWDRNEPAGIENRYTAFGGVGNIWVDRDDLKFRTDYGVSFTKQENVIDPPGFDDTFPGLRFSWSYLNRFGAATEYVNTLVIDDNLDETSDWRADMVNSVAVAINAHLALKVSLQWLYDHEPSFELLTATTDSTGTPLLVPVSQLVELDELDSILTASLVAKF